VAKKFNYLPGVDVLFGGHGETVTEEVIVRGIKTSVTVTLPAPQLLAVQTAEGTIYYVGAGAGAGIWTPSDDLEHVSMFENAEEAKRPPRA
jgi:hypothetical protein